MKPSLSFQIIIELRLSIIKNAKIMYVSGKRAALYDTINSPGRVYI